jgi:N-acetylmuramic acid 6-phosphate etherase
MSENVHPRADGLDSLATLLEVMQAEERGAVDAISSQLQLIEEAVEEIAARLRSGGRLHYFGAGASGRIAALDAAECGPTFGVASDLVQAHNAGDGDREDDSGLGRDHARESGIGALDAAVGISASGGTPYVLAALGVAKAERALTVALTCRPGSPLGGVADIAIEIETGPEVIAGSTRLKAGTVQKVVLNMISTGIFFRLGRTHRGRMVNVVASNDKLRARAARLVTELGGASPEEAQRALSDAAGDAKVAILMLRTRLGAKEARQRLQSAGGNLNDVLAQGRRP